MTASKTPPPPAAAVGHAPLKSTRHALLDLLKREGPSQARALAERLGITPMAVGLQLSALEEEKLVAARPEPPLPGRRGRPVHLWALTEAAARVFPDAHALLTVGLLDSMREVYGEEGMDRLLEARTRHQRRDYARGIPDRATLAEKVKALARLRDREGYMTAVEAAPQGAWRLIENHCPICVAAKVCRGFCRSEWQVFGELMGPGAEVVREEHLLSGARRCAYLIRPAGAGGRETEASGSEEKRKRTKESAIAKQAEKPGKADAAAKDAGTGKSKGAKR